MRNGIECIDALNGGEALFTVWQQTEGIRRVWGTHVRTYFHGEYFVASPRYKDSHGRQYI